MVMAHVIAVVLALGLSPVAAAGPVPAEPRARVEHHVRHAAELADHFDAVLQAACPRFPTRAAWGVWVDGEVERLVLLLAHLEQAWLEAKQAQDDDLRRLAKGPRRRADEVPALVEKLEACGAENGAAVAAASLWRRIEREVPLRQGEIALPH